MPQCAPIQQYRSAAASAYGSSWLPHIRKWSSKAGNKQICLTKFGQTGSSQSQLLGFYCHFDSIFQFYTGDVNNITAVCQQYVKMWKIKVREMYRLKCMGNLTVGNSSVPQGMAWQHTLFEDTTLIFHVSISSFIPFFFFFLSVLYLCIPVTENMLSIG